MATIIKHPGVEDYFVERTLDEITAAPNGLIPDYEANRLILLKNYRVDVDFDAFAQMSQNTAGADKNLRKTLKKLSANHIMAATPESKDPIHRAIIDVLCKKDPALFQRVQTGMLSAHKEVMRLFKSCFPQYEYFRVIPSVRLTQTLFENLHWDNHQIDDDFQQVRIFVNLDHRPRIWNVSHNFVSYAREVYKDHHLEQFAGRDPNEMNDYICGKILGGTSGACTDTLPRHVVAFDPGEVWFGESRMISHQIYYGERAMVYMFFVKPEGMLDRGRRFNAQVESLHKSFAREPALA
ncbi:MAG: hypothetical protein IT548_16495 [Alphaproteobacteria bacterium]|nr:hypothetical protein [Alphaproteobacteria bacterium]